MMDSRFLSSTGSQSEVLFAHDGSDKHHYEELDNIAELASHASGSTYAGIVLIQNDKWSLEAKYGFEFPNTIKNSLSHPIFSITDEVVIADITKSEHFSNPHLFDGMPDIVSYAAFPFYPDGQNIKGFLFCCRQ
jgi:mannosyltransferase OCH1-like enzyme